MYEDQEPIEKSIFDLIFKSCNLKTPKEKFLLEESDLFSIEEMASSPVALMFVEFILKMINNKNVLEIGTFVGVCSLAMAKCLPEDGKVITIEKFEKFAEVAKKNFLKNKLDHKIELLKGDAENIENKKFSRKFDFIFIDGAKEKYKMFLQFSIENINNGGIIFIDDALFHGDVLNKIPSTEKGKGVKDLIKLAKNTKNFEKIFLPILMA